MTDLADYPFPDGVLLPAVFPITVGAPPFILVPGNNLRVYLSVAATNAVGLLVGFSRLIDSATSTGMEVPTTGKVEWKWRDVGPMLYLPLFADDGGFGAVIWIEEIENWPKKPTEREVEIRNRTRNAVALANLRRRTQTIRNATQTETDHVSQANRVRP